jgi:hypothetical protein
VLSGTPGTGTGGTYNISFTASNGVGSNAVQSFTLTVNQASAITSANSTTFTVGAAGSFTVTVAGSPTPTLSESGALPNGVTFNATTGVLSGTPGTGTGGTYNISFTASNGVGSNAVQSFTLAVNQAAAITSANSTTFTVGTAGSFTVMTTGIPAPTLSESGALPSGVTFNATTGVLSGTPGSGTGGTYNISFTASNGVGSNAVQNFTLTVHAKFSTITSLTSTPNPSFVGQAVVFTAVVSSTSGIPPNGELITFKNGTTTLGTAPLNGGTASLTTSSLPVGTSTITASYAGDASYSVSTSAGVNQVVRKYATAVQLSSSLNPAIYGQSVTLTATVSSAGPTTPTGTVTFKNGATNLKTVTLAGGVATMTSTGLPAGTLPLTAVYNGDAVSAKSKSPTLSQVVNQATTTTTVVSSLNPSKQGNSVTFTTTVASPTVQPTGTVTFTAGTAVLATVSLSGGNASVTTSTLPAGSTTVTATYNGTANIKRSSTSIIQVVN